MGDLASAVVGNMDVAESLLVLLVLFTQLHLKVQWKVRQLHLYFNISRKYAELIYPLPLSQQWK